MSTDLQEAGSRCVFPLYISLHSFLTSMHTVDKRSIVNAWPALLSSSGHSAKLEVQDAFARLARTRSILT